MKTSQGFTLVELLVTLLVATLLLTLGVPAMRDFVLDGRIVAATNNFVTSVNLARATAIKQQRNAQICVSTTWNNSPPTCTNGTNWTDGWVVWVDQDADTVLDANEVLRVSETQTGGTSLVGAASTLFQYDPTGFVNAGDTVDICDGRAGETGRRVTVAATGRVNMRRIVCP
ncbi:MAG: GspH/FimT family protein [Gammaproteobacteria bacterium]|nr:GspH/FimT family protein [Gammaproteobacteria bacterium]